MSGKVAVAASPGEWNPTTQIVLSLLLSLLAGRSKRSSIWGENLYLTRQSLDVSPKLYLIIALFFFFFFLVSVNKERYDLFFW